MPENMCQVSSQSKRSFWKHHLERWQQSGLSQRAYCHTHHLKAHQFYYWRRRILEPQTEVSFLPLTLSADPNQQPHLVRILMPNGCALELEGKTEPQELAQLLTVVAAL